MFNKTNILVLDLETTVQTLGGKTDNSPYHPDNKCVSAHFGFIGWEGVDEVTNLVFHHNEKDVPDSPAQMQEALDKATLLICHNAKFDVTWLLEMGFDIPDQVYCTMIGEYILSKGQKRPLSLKAIAERRDVTRKKSDLVDDLFKSGTGFEAMPLATVIEYAEADVISCGEIYLDQQDEYAAKSNRSLAETVKLMNEMLLFLVEIERNGIKIDLDVLGDIKNQFQQEQQDLNKRLEEIVEEVMGDTPINLASGADMTKVVYSREVLDRNNHKQVWNIGVGPTGKPLYPPRMNKSEFRKAVRATTKIIQRTDVICCDACDGRGRIQKFKQITRTKMGKKYRVQGDPYKNLSKCPTCLGVGAFYNPNGITAGLKLNPATPSDASINGFKTDKVTIERLISQAESKGNDIAVEFLTKSSRLNAVNVYLDSFVKGFETWTRSDGILHTQFTQCVTATGRLSSTSPNMQNAPKRGFPVRKAVVSRFENGTVVEADFSSVEFVLAGELSRDTQIISDVINGKDLHKQTATIINQCDVSEVTKEQRQAVKAHSFAPVYGSTGNQYEGHTKQYYTEFFEIYKGLAEYHKRLANGVLKNGIVQTPSGRQFFWPNVKRLKGNRTTFYTQIVNYPVQSSAADLMLLSCVRAFRKFKELKLKSLLVLTVHDSIVCDVYPGELEQVKEALTWAMVGVTEEAAQRWDYTFALPLEIEISGGKNWLEQNEYT
jgi:DNA polymerase I-like protein with 3'-5' exonuclease and polymerase domains